MHHDRPCDPNLVSSAFYTIPIFPFYLLVINNVTKHNVHCYIREGCLNNEHHAIDKIMDNIYVQTLLLHKYSNCVHINYMGPLTLHSSSALVCACPTSRCVMPFQVLFCDTCLLKRATKYLFRSYMVCGSVEKCFSACWCECFHSCK